LWHQRGRDRAGRWLDTPVLGLYQVRDGKLARAQMFYFDPLAAAEFLATSGTASAAAGSATRSASSG
jgi:ketosteroid isomerase-like protein